MRIPAGGESFLEERLDVTDGEKHVTLQTETGTGQDHVAEVVGNRRERVLLHHGPDAAQFALGFLGVVRSHETDLLEQGQVGPVGTLGGIAVIGTNEGIESSLLVDIHVLQRVVVSRHVRPMRGARSKVGHDGSWALQIRVCRESWQDQFHQMGEVRKSRNDHKRAWLTAAKSVAISFL